MSDLVNIYTLSDPRNGEVRYVGKAASLSHRFNRHMALKTNFPKDQWIRSLTEQGLKPVMEVLEEVPRQEWKFWERYWIEMLVFYGCRLTNLSYAGPWGYQTTSARASIKAALTGHLVTAETRKKISDAVKGKTLGLKRSESVKTKMAAAAFKRASSRPVREVQKFENHKKQLYGSSSHLAKLSEDQVREIRSLDRKAPHSKIAQMFNISPTQVSRIINRKKWAHIQ